MQRSWLIRSTAHASICRLESLFLCRTYAKTVTKSSFSLKDLPQGLIRAPLPQIQPLSSQKSDSRAPDCDEVDTVEYPTVLHQVLKNSALYPHCVLITRVGGFYEFYFEAAEIYAPLLSLKRSYKVTRRGEVAMAGFPFFQLDRYLKILVDDLGKFVAIAEEFPADEHSGSSVGGNMFTRKVSRVVTPGTLIDEKFLEGERVNYLLSIFVSNTSHPRHAEKTTKSVSPAILAAHRRSVKESTVVGLSWIDTSTGDFFTQSTTLAHLASHVQRIQPKEAIYCVHDWNNSMNESEEEFFRDSSEKSSLDIMLEKYLDCLTTKVPLPKEPSREWRDLVRSEILESEQYKNEEALACTTLLSYLSVTASITEKMTLSPPQRIANHDIMRMSANTIKSLELRASLSSPTSIRGSLYSAIKRTSSKSGGRLLSEWLGSPLTSIPVLQERLDLVEFLVDNRSGVRDDIMHILSRDGIDVARILQRFRFGRGSTDDLVGVAKAVTVMEQLASLLSSHQDSMSKQPSVGIVEKFDLTGLKELRKRIVSSIDESGLAKHNMQEAEETNVVVSELASISTSALSNAMEVTHEVGKGTRRRRAIEKEDVWTMRPSASPTLKKCHKNLNAMLVEKDQLLDRMRQITGATSLTLRTLPGLSHIVHVSGKDTAIDLALIEGLVKVKSIGSTKSTRSWFVQDWSILGSQIELAKHKIHEEERNTFGKLRKEVLKSVFSLSKNARLIDEIDVACSFAALASEHGWVRPRLDTSSNSVIENGRHPIVEFSLLSKGRQFTKNDCIFSDEKKMYVITGPNMGGKSTFLRQVAIIHILAQIGSFVPASYASIGIVDQIFTRIGSADNLYKDQSTFMVEMMETATILCESNSKSLVVMDEVGRGTSSLDGTSIAFAALEWLHEKSKSRVLFATHFPELAKLTDNFQRAACLCTDLVEELPEAESDEYTESFDFYFSHKVKEGVNMNSHGLKVAAIAGIPNDVLSSASSTQNDLRNKLIL